MEIEEFLKQKQSVLKSMEDTVCFTRDEVKIIYQAVKKQIPTKPVPCKQYEGMCVCGAVFLACK